MQTMQCAGCCTLEDCPCTKECEETYCERHGVEQAKAWAAHFGLRPDMTPAQRRAQLEAVDPRPRCRFCGAVAEVHDTLACEAEAVLERADMEREARREEEWMEGMS